MIYKGLNNEVSKVIQPEGTSPFVLNGINKTINGDYSFISVEPGNELCVILREGFRVIGKQYINDNRIVIFSTDGNTSEIGISKSCKYTPIITEACLNFNTSNQIDTTYRLRRGCEDVIYFTDGLNPVRSINLSKLDDYINEETGEYDCNLFNLQPDYTIPCFINSEILTGGNIPTGTYNFAVQYLDSDLNPTDFFYSSQTVPIYYSDLGLNYSNITGNSNITNDATNGKPNTNKAIKLSLSNLDDKFTYYRILIMIAEGGSGNITQSYLSSPIPINQEEYIYDGDLNNLEEVDYKTINFKREKIETAEHIEQLENRLILGNLKGKKVDFCGFQKAASLIHTNYVSEEIEINNRSFVGNSKNENTYFRKMSYLADEVYAKAIVYVFKDGYESPAYHIPGRPLDQYALPNGQIFTANDSELITTWSSSIEHLVPSSQAEEYNNNPYLTRWEVFNTSTEDGGMSYYQIDNKYLDKEDCNGGDYWGVDYYGNQLKNTNIRHHKFPSRETLGLLESSGSVDTQTCLILSFNVGAFPELPEGEENIYFTLTYTNNELGGVEISEEIIINISQENTLFVAEISCTESDGSVFSWESGFLTGENLEVLSNVSLEQENNTVINSDTKKSYILGIQYNNIIYPHPDIIGHYFVCAKRDTFNRTIIDKGFMGNTRLDDKYLSFTYFNPKQSLSPDNVGNSDKHKYIYYPKFLFKDGNLLTSNNHLTVEGKYKNITKVVYGDEQKDVVKQDGFLWAGEDLNISIDTRVQCYNEFEGFYDNIAIDRTSVFDGAAHSNTYEVGVNTFNTSQNNRVQLLTHNSNFTIPDDELWYVSIKNNQDVHTNLFNIEYVRSHNCVLNNQFSNIVYGGDTFIGELVMTNLSFRRQSKSIIDFLGAYLTIVISAALTIVTAGAATPLLISAVLAVAAIGITSAAVSYLYNEYNKGLGEHLQDDELEDVQQNGLTQKGLNWSAEMLCGILVESDINISLRQPQVNECGEIPRYDMDTKDYFRKKLLYYNSEDNKLRLRPIPCPEVYDYNKDFSRLNCESKYFPIPLEYDCCSECLEEFPHRVAWSEQSFQEELTDNFKVFLSNNYSNIEGENGVITDLLRQNNSLYVYTEEALWVLPQNVQERVTDELISFIGTGEFFSIPPRKVGEDSLGTLGTQHKWATIKTTQGTFSVNQRDNTIYQIGKNVKVISNAGLLRWFENNLTSFLGKQFEEDTSVKYPHLNNTSHTNGVGLISGYDKKYDRVLFTNIDYSLLSGKFVFIEREEEIVEDSGFMYYLNGNFYNSQKQLVKLSNTDYFENKSWTLSYDLIGGFFVSWHSYLPYIYLEDQDTFYSTNQDSIWVHNTKDSFRKYYNLIRPFIVEKIYNGEPLNTKTFEYIIFQTVSYVYNSLEKEWSDDRYETFNKIIAYNTYQSTGELTLEVKDVDKDFFFNSVQQKNDVVEINKDEKDWSINDFRDYCIDNSVPMFTQEWNSKKNNFYIDKVVNVNNIDYNKDWTDIQFLRDKFLSVRFIKDDDRTDLLITVDFLSDIQNKTIR